MSTTFATIAPFLGHDEELVLQHEDGEQFTVLRISLTSETFDAGFADGREFHDFNEQSFNKCLPMLRTFEDACERLADGTVPAQEVAKLSQGRFTNSRGVWGTPELLSDRITIAYKMPNSTVIHQIMKEDWSVVVLPEGEHACNQAAIVDYLRRNLFAVNMRPEQFVPKI